MSTSAPVRDVRWQRVCVFLLGLVPWCSSEGQIPVVYEMGALCSDTLDMAEENITAGIMHLSDNSTSDCWVSLSAPPNRQIVLGLLEMSIRRNKINQTCVDFVDIFSGSENGTVVISPMCGSDYKGRYFHSYGSRRIIIHYKNDFHSSDEGFKALFTSFHKGPCIKDVEYKCDNGYCIDADLRCNGYNHCSDDTDTCPPYVALIFGLLFIAGIMCSAAVAIKWMIRQQHRTRFHKGGYVIKTETRQLAETLPMTETRAIIQTDPSVMTTDTNTSLCNPPGGGSPPYQPHGYPSATTQEPGTFTPPRGSSGPPAYSGYGGYQQAAQAGYPEDQSYLPSGTAGHFPPASKTEEPPPYEEKPPL